MILKDYLIKKDKNFFKNFKSLLFYGENEGLKKDFNQFIKKNSENAEILIFDSKEILDNNELFYNELTNQSLFSKEKIIFVNKATDKITNLILDFTNLKTNAKLILFSDLLDKKSKLRNLFEKEKELAIIACYKDLEFNLLKYVNEKLKDIDGYTNEIGRFICKNSDFDRSKVQNEISKIKMCFVNDKVNLKKLEVLINYNETEKFDELRDNALLGEKNKTNLLLSSTIISQDQIILNFNSIIRRIIKLIEILEIDKMNKNLDVSINTIKPPIFWKEKDTVKKQCKLWNLQKLKMILIRLSDIEKQLKTESNISKVTLLKSSLIDVCLNATNS